MEVGFRRLWLPLTAVFGVLRCRGVDDVGQLACSAHTFAFLCALTPCPSAPRRPLGGALIPFAPPLFDATLSTMHSRMVVSPSHVVGWFVGWLLC